MEKCIYLKKINTSSSIHRYGIKKIDIGKPSPQLTCYYNQLGQHAIS